MVVGVPEMSPAIAVPVSITAQVNEAAALKKTFKFLFSILPGMPFSPQPLLWPHMVKGPADAGPVWQMSIGAYSEFDTGR